MSRIIAFDLGSKTLGVAISDSLGIAAHSLRNFTFKQNDYYAPVAYALEIIKKKQINEIVIGSALHMNGCDSKSSKASRMFKDELIKRNPNLKVTLIDERLTTVLATRRLLESDISRSKRKKVIDMQSAVAILETYLRMKKNGKI